MHRNGIMLTDDGSTEVCRQPVDGLRRPRSPEKGSSAMKNTLMAVAAAALIAVVGCNTGTPGGPGVDKNKDNKSKVEKAKDAVGTADDTFTLSAPPLAAKLNEG